MAKLRYKRALTTEDRFWKYVAEQTKLLYEMAVDEDMPNPSKKSRAEGLYHNLREALKSLGVVR